MRGAVRRGARCDQMPMPGGWLVWGGPFGCAALLTAQPFWLRGCAVEAMEAWWGAGGGVVGCRWRCGRGAVGALNDASALAVGALEPVLDLIALDEGGYQRAHRAHLRRRVPGRVPRGMLHGAQRQGAAARCSGGRGEWRRVARCGGVAWRRGGRRGGAAGTIAGGQAGPVRGRLRQARRHRAAEEAVDRALAEDHVALVSHLTHDARPSQSTGLGPT